MQNFPAWLEKTLNNFEKPSLLLTHMSGGKIDFTLDKDSVGDSVLKGRFGAPLPGLYYLTLNMTSGDELDQIDYSQSFWVTYEPKTGAQVTISKANQDVSVSPPYFPDAWGKVSNANLSEEEENLTLNIDENSVRITPDGLATPRFDPKHPGTIILHSLRKDNGRLSFDVTTDYGDEWTLTYDIIAR